MLAQILFLKMHSEGKVVSVLCHLHFYFSFLSHGPENGLRGDKRRSLLTLALVLGDVPGLKDAVQESSRETGQQVGDNEVVIVARQTDQTGSRGSRTEQQRHLLATPTTTKGKKGEC